MTFAPTTGQDCCRRPRQCCSVIRSSNVNCADDMKLRGFALILYGKWRDGHRATWVAAHAFCHKHLDALRDVASETRSAPLSDLISQPAVTRISNLIFFVNFRFPPQKVNSVRRLLAGEHD